MTEKAHENGPQWQASDHRLDGDGSSGRTRLKKTSTNIGIKIVPYEQCSADLCMTHGMERESVVYLLSQ